MMKTKADHRLILTMETFTRWAEAVALVDDTTKINAITQKLLSFGTPTQERVGEGLRGALAPP